MISGIWFSGSVFIGKGFALYESKVPTLCTRNVGDSGTNMAKIKVTRGISVAPWAMVFQFRNAPSV